MPKVANNSVIEELPVVSKEYANGLSQLGTLGGGNHFIEIQKGNDGYIWIMAHSGSRNIGYKVANYYNRLAVDLNSRSHSIIPKNWQLAFLSLSSDVGQQYLHEMQFCVEFALANQQLMMARIQKSRVTQGELETS